MLPRAQRLTSAQFERAFSNSQVVRHPLVALRVHRRVDESQSQSRAAFVVPKKQGQATQRNRTKRRLREQFWLLDVPFENLNSCDLIFLTSPAAHGASNAELRAALEDVLRRAAQKMSTDFKPQKPREPKPIAQSQTSTSVDETQVAARVDEAVIDETQAEAFVDEPLQFTLKNAPFTFLALSAIRFYRRFVSPALPPSCRFYPTCSRYTHDAIERFGLARGLVLGAGRVCRCNPLHPGGVDLVPARFPVGKPISIRNFLARRRFSSSKK